MNGWLRIIGSVVACIALLAASATAIVVINRTEPTAQTINATRKSAALVETVTAERGTYSPRLVVLGVVEAAQQIVLSPRISGQVASLSPGFVPGGMVQAGERLLQIDPSDFENALSIRQSELEQAKASLAIEEGRQSLAKKELDLLQGTIDGTNRALVLREPQFASIKAEVAAAEAAVERAKLDLQRTQIVAPFEAQILSRSVNVGSQVSPGDELAQLVGVDEYWIRASVPVRSLRWVQFPRMEAEANTDEFDLVSEELRETSTDRKGSAVILRNEDAWGPVVQRQATVTRMIGTLDEQTRLARVLISVDDPLGQQSNAPPLIIGTLIETEIIGTPIDDTVRLNRQYVRENDTVWVMNDDKLQIREVQIVFRDADYAYIQSGLETGEEVVTTTLATVADGVGLRKVDSTLMDDTESNEATD